MATLNKAQFQRYQNRFFKEVTASPYKVVIETVTVTPGGSRLEAFLGDSKRSSTETTLPCLYEKTVNPRVREKYGLPDTVDGIVFISPIQLVKLFGTFKLDKNKTKFHHAGRVQVIDNIDYLEPIFDSCIAVQFSLKDDLKGG